MLTLVQLATEGVDAGVGCSSWTNPSTTSLPVIISCSVTSTLNFTPIDLKAQQLHCGYSFESELLYSNQSRKARLPNEGHFANFFLLSFFDFSRDVAMATSQSRKIGVFPEPIYFVAMPFGNGMG